MSDKRVIQTGTQLSQMIDDVINESLKSNLTRKRLEEKEKQSSFTQRPRQHQSVLDEDDNTDLFSDDSDSNDSGDKEQQSKPKQISDDKLQSGDIAADDIIDRLNSIRSGKSFKDDRISQEMDQYVNGLKKAEKVALLAFLKGIAQIVTGEFEGSTAVEPDSHPADVKMKKSEAGDSKQTKHVEPNVIKGVSKEKKATSNTEDTSAPAPIVAKKKQ